MTPCEQDFSPIKASSHGAIFPECYCNFTQTAVLQCEQLCFSIFDKTLVEFI